ncbi:MAG: hypothetical protein FWH47_02250 [Methanomassiliicoccaceae archaeon]|nr:hypothetical protein [Methanomassiliicoccaceae archaeon]
MTNEDYMKCRTCRFCIHSQGDWVCSAEGRPTASGGTCGRYRPGSCENCNSLVSSGGKTLCGATGEEAYVLSVCSLYDPSGRRSV